MADYLSYDEMTTRFASMVATARFGERVITVQYRVGRRIVPARGDAKAGSVSKESFDWFDFGFRRAFHAPYGAQLAFERYAVD